MKNRLHRISAALLAAALFFQIAACGTLLYPERRGQQPGRIDVGVAVLDGVGLLFFVVPGIVAFAVDFATGAIFLPPGQTKSEVFALKDLNEENIEGVILNATGKTVDLNHPDLVVIPLNGPWDLPGQYAKWTSSVERSSTVAVIKD